LSELKNNKVKAISAYSVNSFEFLGADAEEKIKKVFETAEESVPSVIFIDNIEEMCSKDNIKRVQSSPVFALSSCI
jgi:AAA+ superfamily predicted ATPase